MVEVVEGVVEVVVVAAIGQLERRSEGRVCSLKHLLFRISTLVLAASSTSITSDPSSNGQGKGGGAKGRT